MFLPSQYNFHFFHITVVRDSLGCIWTIKSCTYIWMARQQHFTTLQEWFFSADSSSSNISCLYLLNVLAQDLHVSIPTSISFPLCSLAKVYFVIFHYFVTSLNIVVIITIIPFTSTCTFHIGYLASTFTYCCILQKTLWKPHADTESLCITSSLIYLPQNPWDELHLHPHTHTFLFSFSTY